MVFSSKAFKTIIVLICFTFILLFFTIHSYDSDINEILPFVQNANACAECVNNLISYDKDANLSACQRSQVTFLVGKHNIVDADIGKERILLLLSSDDYIFLRIAQWDDMLNQYSIIDTDWLPAKSWLDTYHNGDAVLLTIPFNNESDTANSTRIGDWIYLTFQYQDDSWYLTDFTDGYSFVAFLDNRSYIFDDYYESATEYRWTMDSILFFDHFSPTELFQYIYAYDVAKPNRPSLTDELQ